MYNTYFGFREAPFSVTPDPRFLYTNPIYEEAYATLQYGIEGKKGFIVIAGEVGTGKTTLLRKLMRNLDGTVHSVFVFNTHLTFPELLQVILHDLGLDPKAKNKVAMLQQLNEYVIKQLKQGDTVAILVDEAQNLTDDALENLRLLSNLETDHEKLIQIVLMGQPELEAKLDQPGLRQLKQRVALRCRLAPLKEEEVGAYIDFRLRTAGYKGKDLFDADAVQRIASYSNGIPRLINIICDNALLCVYARSQRLATGDIVKEVAFDLRATNEWLPRPAPVATASERETVKAVSTAEAAPPPPPPRRRWVRIGAETVLALLLLIAVAAVLDPRTFLTHAGRGWEVASRNLGQWVALVREGQPLVEAARADVPSNGSEQSVVMEPGSNIYKIAANVYGAKTLLGMDLIKEFNPQIKNLNRVAAGQPVLLPGLTEKRLLREQPDGSYELVVAAFRTSAKAHEFGRLLSEKGHRVEIMPRRVSDDLLLHRVQIDGLRNLEEAKQLWKSELGSESLAIAGNAETEEWPR